LNLINGGFWTLIRMAALATGPSIRYPGGDSFDRIDGAAGDPCALRVATST